MSKCSRLGCEVESADCINIKTGKVLCREHAKAENNIQPALYCIEATTVYVVILPEFDLTGRKINETMLSTDSIETAKKCIERYNKYIKVTFKDKDNITLAFDKQRSHIATIQAVKYLIEP